MLPLALSTPSLPRTLTDRAVLIELGRVELQEGEGDIKTAEGGGVLALTGVLDLLNQGILKLWMLQLYWNVVGLLTKVLLKTGSDKMIY